MTAITGQILEEGKDKENSKAKTGKPCCIDNALEPVCADTVIHEDTVRRVKAGLSDTGQLKTTAEMFKAFGDPTRLRIINALILSEMCVCDIAALLEMTQPAVSHHLKILRQLQLVKYRKDGKAVYYELDDEHVRNMFYQGLLHASEK
ncbi:MAG: metalloregulator ArsR/SmtB family transcription factor [Oscillospiraceae bacterium]|nr:metalloregulator ArsR/SmtB family transcription factor [Oscillospiraceae bacterium]